MPEHVLTPEIEFITNGDHRRRWTAAEKLQIVEETLDDQASFENLEAVIYGTLLMQNTRAKLLICHETAADILNCARS